MPERNSTVVSHIGADHAPLWTIPTMPAGPLARARRQQRDRLCFIMILMITIARSIAVIATPLGLGVDEAQYWLWSQEFDFGYYTKPPLTSWIIGLSHALFGHETWAVRLPAAWLHLATALVLWRAAAWLYGDAAGRWAAMLWILLPAVTLGSAIISTDTPLLLAWSLGLLAIISVMTGRHTPHRGLLFAGLALGAGMLAKYAAAYFILSLLLFFIWQQRHKSFCGMSALLAFAGGLLLAASPNLTWNLLHDFTTVRHLGDNANLGRQSHDTGNMLGFFAAQFGVGGPAVFGLMCLIILPPYRDPARRMLICFSAPPILIIAIQAFFSEANANWAVAAMPALVIWLDGWLASPGGLRWGLLANAVNGGIASAVIAGVSLGHFGFLTPASDPLRRLRGWDALAADIRPEMVAHQAHVIVADRRASAALLSWHFHNDTIASNPVIIRVHDDDAIPSNHFEQNMAWQPTPGRRLVAIDGRGTPPPLPGVIWATPGTGSEHMISATRSRRLMIYRGVEPE